MTHKKTHFVWKRHILTLVAVLSELPFLISYKMTQNNNKPIHLGKGHVNSTVTNTVTSKPTSPVHVGSIDYR